MLTMKDLDEKEEGGTERIIPIGFFTKRYTPIKKKKGKSRLVTLQRSDSHFC